MKLKYSIHYTSEVFLRCDTVLMGALYVGNQKLLEQLELRAAMPRTVKSDVEREADYLNAMRNHVSGTVFEKPAQVDELGVARRLLQWRDALLMAGWDGKCDDEQATKLMVLAVIEQDFYSAGNADRWKAVAEAYNKEAILCGTEIDVECPWSELPHLVQMTFEGIERHGGTIRRMKESGEEADININKVEVVEFEDVNDAYEWIATIEQVPENTLVVNRNNMRLNHILYTWNKARTAATLHDSNPQLLQLFKLGMNIFSRPLNVRNIASYLQLPLSPIPAPLRKDLAKLLLKEGGFGETIVREDGKLRNEWDEKVERYEFLNNEGMPTRQAREKKMVFLAPIRNDYSEGIKKEELTDYISNMLKWINGFEASDRLSNEEKVQMHELKALFNSLDTAMKAIPETVEYKDIEMLVRSIYRPMNYNVQPMEQGALDVVADIRQMAEPAECLVWLDCQDEDKERDAYDFLSKSERAYLNSKGVVLPDFQLHLRNVRCERLRKLNEIGEKVILVKSAYDGITRMGEHSLIAEVSHAYQKGHLDTGNVLPVVNKEAVFKSAPIGMETENVEIFAPAESYELGALENLGRKESNSSIDTLINYPFDYVMQYVARLYQPDEEQVNNTFVTVGLVAHSFFEHIIEDAKGDLGAMRKMANEEFNQRLNASIDATGLILRLSENASELDNFAKHLKNSFLSLVDIMEHLRLKPMGCEINLPDEDGELKFDVIGDFGARIDLLLTDENNEYVVFDFKWSYGKSYKENLENNLAIQLELYRQAVCETYKGKQVRGVGYYIMPRKELLTNDFNEISRSKLVKHIESKDTNLFEQIKNSYQFRMKELKRGHVEEAEEIDIKDNADCYYAWQEKRNLYPIGSKKKSNSVFRPSKKPKFGNTDLTPSEKSTKNAILKGRLK